VIGKPLPFVTAFIETIDEVIRDHHPGHGLSALQRAWLAFCVTAILVTNSICWARFARAQGVRRCGLRHARYMGFAKTHLQHLATAAAFNFVRIGEWLAGTPLAKTRRSPFATLSRCRSSS
jgi:hypothetical protein